MSAADEFWVPGEPDSGDGHTEAVFEEMMKDVAMEYDPALIQLSPEARSTYMAVEALTQVIAALHATDDLMAMEELQQFEELDEVLEYGPLSWLAEQSDSGEDRLAVLDELTRWGAVDGFARLLASALGSWLEAHLLPPHIHLWVQLPGLGFMPVLVGYGEEANLLMPLPTGYLFGDKDLPDLPE